jgi:alkylation response protein AidB-like acyl-CoA dehydrogenase
MEFSWSETSRERFQRTFDFCRHRLNGDKGSQEAWRALWRCAGDFGLLGLTAPESLGGGELGALECTRVLEAVGAGSPNLGFSFAIAAHLFACVMPLCEAASEPLKRELVPKLLSGEWVGANAITEAEAGSDVYAMRITVIAEGGGFVLNGAKSYVSNAPLADLFLVYAMTNRAHGHLGVTAFAVRRDTPGLSVGRPFAKLGLVDCPIASIYMDGCLVPQSHIVGGVGRGAHVFETSMAWERACLFALYVGAMERQLESCIERVRTRLSGGKPLSRHQAVAHRVADMKLRLEAARLLLYRACWAKDHEALDGSEVSLAKIAVAEAAVQSALDAIQLFGGDGCISETGVADALCDAIPARIFSGTSEVQRNLVARALGL